MSTQVKYKNYKNRTPCSKENYKDFNQETNTNKINKNQR